MINIIEKNRIQEILNEADPQALIACIEKAFVGFSSKASVIAPVGTLTFNEPPGDMHFKSGYFLDEDHYVVKIASGFYKNPELGLPSSNGLNLMFNQNTGTLETILLDEGLLTDTRTALAGAVAAKHLAPKVVHRIGIIGTGIQAKLQLKYLKHIIDCNKVMVWGRSATKLEIFKTEMETHGFEIETTQDADAVAQSCQLIVTTTPTTMPILSSNAIQEGTHITAVGADTEGKQELDIEILQRASLIVTDSNNQCITHGEIHKAVRLKAIDLNKIEELGDLIGLKKFQRKPTDITVADLTGIATQDIQISNFILSQIANKK